MHHHGSSLPSVLDALVIVPPFVKSTSGPPLGPAMLRGAGSAAGFDVKVLDLAIETVTSLVSGEELRRSAGLAGDHDKNEPALRDAQSWFFEPVAQATGISIESLVRCQLSWAEVESAVMALAATPWAVDVRTTLGALPAPRVVGVSVMFSDQVLAGLVVTRAARSAWPRVPVLWGGAHVTALAPELAADVRYGQDIDGFVAGYAERTFVDLLASIRDAREWPADVLVAGSGERHRARGTIETTPCFPSLAGYGAPRLTLPAQVTRGCAYGKCGFCTYPFVEGQFAEPPSLDHIEAVIAVAAEHDAVVSFKDALLTAPYLRRVAALVSGRVRWAACTKLAPALIELLPALGASGCETLEVGLETIVERSQLVILKPVSRRLVESFLRAAQAARVRVVVNYMTGLPGECLDEAAAGLRWITALAEATGAVVEHHEFELERRAPLARSLRVTGEWPWASVVAWEPAVITEAA